MNKRANCNLNITAVQVNDLSAGYGGADIVSGISFEVEPGEILTMIGPNGGGKSTVLKAMCGLIKRSGGSVEICGKNADTLSRTERSRILSVMLTERIRPDLMTCREVIAAGRYPYTGTFGALTEEDEKIVESAVRTVNAEDFADSDFNSVSDGQRQRVLLARAICQQPRVLILDEPTSYLDIRHKIAFFEILRGLADEGLAVVMSLHELDFAEKISDNVICIQKGTLRHTDDPIFSPENVCGLYSIQRNLYDKYFG